MTLVAAAAAGFVIWFAPHFQRWAAGGYWGVIGLMTLAGALIGLSQLHARDGNPLASFLVAFLPVLVAASWVILASQPHANEIQKHIRLWSGDLGISDAVRNLSEHVTVLAFGLGMVFGVTFEPRMVRRGPRRRATRVGALTGSGAAPTWDDVAEKGKETAAGGRPKKQPPEAVPPDGLIPPAALLQPVEGDQTTVTRLGAVHDAATVSFAQEPTVEQLPVWAPPVEESRVEDRRGGEPPVDETTVITSSKGAASTSSASSNRPVGWPDLHDEEPTVVAQESLPTPVPPLVLPKRFMKSWFVSNGPLLHPAQLPLLLAELQRRGWTEETIQQRVIPHLPHWAEADPSTRPESVS